MKKIKYEDIINFIFGTGLIMIITILMIYGIQYMIQDPRDVNRDGKVNSQDYVEIKNYIMEKEYNYDVNDDGKTDIEDLLLLQKYLVGGE